MPAVKKSFESADETRKPDKTTIEVVDLGSAKAARVTFEPGWRWSECIKPVVGTDSCQALHIGAVASGTLHIKTDDGVEFDVGPGDAYVIEPGHDTWNTGNEQFVGYEFETHTAESYGRSS